MSFPPATAAAQSIGVEAPVRIMMLRDGTPRFVIDLTVDGRTVETGLDTGSVGLRVLADREARGGSEEHRATTATFRNGTRLFGDPARRPVQLGATNKVIGIQQISGVACAATRPRCPVANMSFREYGVMGNGVPGEGFRAIAGIGLGASSIENPLTQLGAMTWLLRLPRPDGAAGALILNPDATEAAGAVPLKVAGNRSPDGVYIAGCLLAETGKAQACGRIFIDTGAPGIVVSGCPGFNMVEGGKGRFLFNRADKFAPLALDIEFGSREQATRLTVMAGNRDEGCVIRSGLAAYYAYDVIYDAVHGSIAFKARARYPGGANAH